MNNFWLKKSSKYLVECINACTLPKEDIKEFCKKLPLYAEEDLNCEEFVSLYEVVLELSHHGDLSHSKMDSNASFYLGILYGSIKMALSKFEIQKDRDFKREQKKKKVEEVKKLIFLLGYRITDLSKEENKYYPGEYGYDENGNPYKSMPDLYDEVYDEDGKPINFYN